MKNTFTRFSAFIIMMCFSAAVFAQGVTSASINGSVSDASESLIGANIMAVHLPTGTVYGNSTNVDGLFRIPNMRVGGPYTITISYTGYDDFIKENVYLQLGQSYRINAKMQEDAVTLEGVEVVSSRSDVFDGNRTGAETTVTEEQIAVLPTLDRAIGDFARVTPQASVRQGDDGLEINLNGSNNRYNAIYLDGAISNDVFGLAASGTNGGQTGVSPLPIDAIEGFQISIAPFDVRLGGFSGGAINALTRSGTNNTEISAYTFLRNETLAGKTPTDNDDVDRTRLDDFMAQTSGVRVGGALIKDKLFYFINAEVQREETPLPFEFADYDGDSDLETINAIGDKLRGLGYEPGGFLNNRGFLNSEKAIVKLDYNINQNHKASLRYQFTNARNLENAQSFSRRIVFQNRAEYFESTTNGLVFELNSMFGTSMANNLKVGYTSVVDDRDPYQGEGGQRDERDNPNYFPTVTVNDGSGSSIRFGAEPFSTANQLEQKIFTITDNFEIYKGRHNITIGTHNEFYDMYNLFVAFNYGEYQFNSANDFLNDSLPSFYQRAFSLRDNVTGDGSAAGVAFNAGQLGVYVQDEYQVNDNLKVTLGVRADMPFYGDTPANPAFNESIASTFEAEGYDVRGARLGDFINQRVMFSPRLGFNWDLTGEQKTQLRGGIGVFTSRAPLVWVGGAYNNSGLTQGYTRDFDAFIPQWDQQLPVVDVNAPQQSGGNIDLFAEDFKLPQVLKFNLALDHKLPWGVVANADFIYNKTLQDVAYQNINVGNAVGNLTGTPDTRPVYDRRDEVNADYGRVILGYNTNEGYAYNATFSLTKPFDNGFSGMMAYSYGDSFKVFDGTSSQNSSQWRGLYTVQGRNVEQPLTRSIFSQGSRVIAALAYALKWNEEGNVKTTFSIFHESIQGRPYSYIYNDFGNLNNEDSRAKNLIYIPATQDDIILVQDGDRTPDQQWADLNEFIENDEYLSENRGSYAERNQNRMPWEHILDFKLLQDFSFVANEKRHTVQFTFDIFNFTNLLNKDWGRRYRNPFSEFQLIDFEGFEDDPTTPEVEEFRPTFTHSKVEGNDISSGFVDDAGTASSRWQMQIGVRYLFK